MIKTRILTDRKEIERVIPWCVELAHNSGCTFPFNYMHISLLWWDHFNSKDGVAFSKKRGTNFLGAQSHLDKLYLLIAEDNEIVCGAVLLVSFSVKVPEEVKPLRILSFAGDYQLIPYQDFLVLSSMRTNVISSMFTMLIDLLKNEHDLLFLGYLSEESPNISVIRELVLRSKQKDINCLETVTGRRGGVWPWTIDPITSYCKKLYEKIDNHNSVRAGLCNLIESLQNCNTMRLLFSGTRSTLESQVRGILAQLGDCESIKKDIEAIANLLSHTPVAYYYIELPRGRELYLGTMGKKARRNSRYYKRQFEQQGGSFEKISSDKITDRDIEDYLNFHLLRWGEGSASLSNTTIDFHKYLCDTMVKHGVLTLFFTCWKGERIATLSTIDIMPRREAYIMGRDPKHKELSGGSLLMLEAIYDAIDNGFGVYDFGLGWSPQKESLTKAYTISRNLFLTPDRNVPDLNRIFMGYEYMGLDMQEL